MVGSAKNPRAESPAGWVLLESLWPLSLQTIDLRRHGLPMMVVMAVMEEGLHLGMKLTDGRGFVKPEIRPGAWNPSCAAS
jgi:hypothetical protein